ncbi:MAG: 5'/3'-nucleotidase SurE [Oscillospiraceae bacterium]|nr:5'/3'-nucleotidase SurE [Oscillospiraceae bacterium]
MRKKILIVNDDGIASEGLRKLAEAAARFGPVWVAAPTEQCSAMSQRITVFDKITVAPYPFPAPVEAAWAVGGTPADCVKAALNYLLPERPDLVISGINNGYNTGFDIAYSGTVGAAMEALMQGIPAMAFSNGYNGSFETTDAYLPLLLEDLIQDPPPENGIWNVNFPGIPLEECQGIQRDCAIAPLQLYGDFFRREELEDGAFTLHNQAILAVAKDAPEGTDVRAVLSGYVSVGTVRCSVLTGR